MSQNSKGLKLYRQALNDAGKTSKTLEEFRNARVKALEKYNTSSNWIKEQKDCMEMLQATANKTLAEYYQHHLDKDDRPQSSINDLFRRYRAEAMMKKHRFR